jgi:hypothetical protein
MFCTTLTEYWEFWGEMKNSPLEVECGPICSFRVFFSLELGKGHGRVRRVNTLSAAVATFQSRCIGRRVANGR